MPKNMFNVRDITVPKNGDIVYKNSYWVCEEGDPTRALFYGRAPQCNSVERITTSIIEKQNLYKGWNVSVVYLEIAYVPARD